MHLPWWFGIVLSVLFALLRYRIPAVPSLLASAAIGACLVLAALGFADVSPSFGVSLVINGALIGLIADAAITRRWVRKEHATPQERASVTLDFRPGLDPKRVTDENVHSVYSGALYFTELTPFGPQRHLTQWYVSVWFRGPIFGYNASVDVVSGEATKATIVHQCDSGLVAVVEIPKGGVIQIKAEKHPPA